MFVYVVSHETCMGVYPPVQTVPRHPGHPPGDPPGPGTSPGKSTVWTVWRIVPRLPVPSPGFFEGRATLARNPRSRTCFNHKCACTKCGVERTASDDEYDDSFPPILPKLQQSLQVIVFAEHAWPEYGAMSQSSAGNVVCDASHCIIVSV